MKILILTVSAGTGHVRAAQALECAINEAYPDATVKTVDVLGLTNRIFRKMYCDGYLSLTDSAPHFYGYLYDLFDRPSDSIAIQESMRGFIQRRCLGAFSSYIKEESWDVIVNTHFLPTEMVAELKRSGKLDIPQITVVTDFDAHRFWAYLPCEQFFVPSQEAAASLNSWNVSKESISIAGIPIHPVFSRLPKRATCLKSHGLAGDRPIVLQMSGGSGVGAIDDICTGLLSIETPLELIVVTGRNQAARDRLQKINAPVRHRLHVLGYTEKVHELMSVADLLVSKPGGLTTSEALACGVPIVALMPVSGQESRNCDFLLENGAGVRVNSVPTLPSKTAALLNDPERLKMMRKNAAKLGRADAAFVVARKAADLALGAAGRVRSTAGQKEMKPTAHSRLALDPNPSLM